MMTDLLMWSLALVSLAATHETTSSLLPVIVVGDTDTSQPNERLDIAIACLQLVVVMSAKREE